MVSIIIIIINIMLNIIIYRPICDIFCYTIVIVLTN